MRVFRKGSRAGLCRGSVIGAAALLPACIFTIVDPEGTGGSADTGDEEVQVYTILDTPEELAAPILDVRNVVATDLGFYFHVVETGGSGRSHVGKIPYYADSSCADWCYLRAFGEGELVEALDANRAADRTFEPLMLYSGADGLHHVELDDSELARSATTQFLNAVASSHGEPLACCTPPGA